MTDLDVRVDVSRQAIVQGNDGRMRNLFQEGTAAVRIICVLPPGFLIGRDYTDDEIASLVISELKKEQ